MALIATCLLWMDPIGLARAGFDARKLAAETFNFLYTERTQTLNWPTWVGLPDAADLRGVDDRFTASPTCWKISNWSRGRRQRGFQLSELDGVN